MNIKDKLSRIGGIYAVHNKITEKFYIGQTKDFYKRYTHYCSAFKNNGNTGNKALVRDVIKYGKENFSFKVLEIVSTQEMKDNTYLDALEDMYLNCAYFGVYNYSHRKKLKAKGIKIFWDKETGLYSWSM
ncbi:hypothetical protein C7H19_08630 [Aphanothece hegewaldii CCALA 016]|uniref:GIY-YIG domain-containing protein n=1 Tax=Aphanothece hegewaldii CCALA 016 TaxID=2107694 RepID=A0A2T1LYY4_9CHRO|nr:GIY-YIG nuclease family protein [Aphanothece hegewaldii]PSF37612.1 hypothetical protein C7H19_08630 [Aphanothece hegewaldii CCALA 016]